MKRFLAFLLLLFYVASVSGATFSVHFCGNKLRKISIAGFEHKGCCCKKPMTGKGCCKDQTITFKSGKEHKRIESLNAPVSIPKLIPAQLPAFLCSSIPAQSPVPAYYVHPPPKRGENQTLLVLNSVFRV